MTTRQKNLSYVPFVALFALINYSSMTMAAIPQQTFSECFRGTGGTTLSVDDYKSISKVSKQTFCQKSASPFAKADLIEILKNHTEMGISVAGTQWSQAELIEMAKSGSLTLIVDGPRFNRESLIEIGKAGAQIAVISSAGFSKDDLIIIAKQVPLLVAVNSNMIKDEMKQLVSNRIQLVVYLAESGVGTDDLLEVVKSNPDLVTIKP